MLTISEGRPDDLTEVQALLAAADLSTAVAERISEFVCASSTVMVLDLAG